MEVCQPSQENKLIFKVYELGEQFLLRSLFIRKLQENAETYYTLITDDGVVKCFEFESLDLDFKNEGVVVDYINIIDFVPTMKQLNKEVIESNFLEKFLLSYYDSRNFLLIVFF